MTDDDYKPRSIIAMKGLPSTGKTVAATIIAGFLKCPVLSLDDVLVDLHPEYLITSFPSLSSSLLSSSSLSPPSLARDIAFKILCQITYTQLSQGFVENIVIDSPLSSRAHLDLLITLASSTPKTRLVIIECKRYNKYKWQGMFEKYIEANSVPWYKAKEWDEVIKAINDNYDERSDNYKVSKLVFDPFSVYQLDLTYNTHTHLWRGEPLEQHPFMEAVNYMITREECEAGPYIVDYNQWRQSKYLPPIEGEQSSMSKKGFFCSGGHHSITNYTEKLGPEYEDANCTVCEQRVTLGAVYTCTDCSLALHKECVEPSSNLQPSHITKNMILLPCSLCKKKEEEEDEVEYDFDCESCKFESILRRNAYERVASVVRHDCVEHFLEVDEWSSMIHVGTMLGPLVLNIGTTIQFSEF